MFVYGFEDSPSDLDLHLYSADDVNGLLHLLVGGMAGFVGDSLKLSREDDGSFTVSSGLAFFQDGRWAYSLEGETVVASGSGTIYFTLTEDGEIETGTDWGEGLRIAYYDGSSVVDCRPVIFQAEDSSSGVIQQIQELTEEEVDALFS